MVTDFILFLISYLKISITSLFVLIILKKYKNYYIQPLLNAMIN